MLGIQAASQYNSHRNALVVLAACAVYAPTGWILRRLRSSREPASTSIPGNDAPLGREMCTMSCQSGSYPCRSTEQRQGRHTKPLHSPRYLVATVIAGLLVLGAQFEPTSVSHAKDRFPYTVFTTYDETAVLSGPGEEFYATDLLAKGTPLEVYRRDPGGWLAVRPPDRSFSWVPARKLLVAANNQSATVVGDDAVAWVGSRVETVEDHRWQVQLERGERVAILGHRALEDHRKGTVETWYQVAPPSGEFRWVHADDITRRAPRRSGASRTGASYGGQSDDSDSVPRADGSQPDGLENSDPADEASPGAAPLAQAGANEISPPSDSVRRANLTTPRGGSPSEPRSVEPAQFRADWTPRSAPRQARRTDPSFISSEPQPPAPTTSPAAERELEDITVQLSMLAAREPNLWNLAPLRARTETLIERGSNPLERGKARLMLEKIEEFEELQQRHIRAERGLAANSPTTPGAQNPAASTGLASALPIGSGLSGLGFVSTGKLGGLAGGASAAGTGASGSAPARNSTVEPRFDGTGWLLPVHSTKRVAPPYALMDDSGHVLHYVSPAPGLNLHRYERKRVGIYGQRGQTQTLNAPHLTAHRVVDLDRQASRP